MRSPAAPAASLLGLAAMLIGCTDPGTVEPTDSVTGPAPAQTPAELVLPEDAVLGLVGILTAPNGASADFSVVVHAALPTGAPGSGDGEAAILSWCAGEIDQQVLDARGFTLTAVDVALTAREGDWPQDTVLAVLPQPNPEVGSVVAGGGGLRQVDQAADPTLGGAVPHCLQPAVLDGLGSGTLHLGIPNDISGENGVDPFTSWTLHDYGLTAVLPGSLGGSAVEFSSCAASISQLGGEFGAGSARWREQFDQSGCIVGAGPARG